MDDHARNVFLVETRKQAQMALNAMTALANLHNRMSERVGDPNFDSRIMHSEHFRTVHSFLTHLSNVSRLIWPPASTSTRCGCKKLKEAGRICDQCVARERAAILQKVLGLVDVEHVIKQRTLRDHLEHFDERLDNWQQTSVQKNILQDYIGPKGAISGFDDSDMMRQLDPTSGEFIFRGQAYNLIHLAQGASDILSRADNVLIAEGVYCP